MRLNFSTCHIFLLNIYHEYEEKRLSLKEFEEILRYLESYFVRRLFADISTRTLGIVFNNLYSEVQKANATDLVDALRTVLIGYEKTKIWPNDDEFRQGIITQSVYSNSSIDRTKLILESIEEFLTKERVAPENLTIEHIMPQNPKLNDAWRSMLGNNSSNVQKKWLHTLGNLTLTANNSKLSDKPWAEKLKILKDSNLTLNQYFRNIDVWNEQPIKNRAERLADIALKVWPR